jgi:ubiquinone/menaquinone biosynthesis C-methylase UbiE
MADELFENPRLAVIYDAFDPDRSDLEAYESMVDEFGARVVLDVGCGTGTFACRLANQLAMAAINRALRLVEVQQK